MYGKTKVEEGLRTLKGGTGNLVPCVVVVLRSIRVDKETYSGKMRWVWIESFASGWILCRRVRRRSFLPTIKIVPRI